MLIILLGTAVTGVSPAAAPPFLSQIENIPAAYWVAGIACIASLVWLTTTLFGFWRVGRLSSDLYAADQKAELAEHLLRGDVRRPVWVWHDGRCQGDPTVEALLNCAGPITTLADIHHILRSGTLYVNGKPVNGDDIGAVTDPVSGSKLQSVFTPDTAVEDPQDATKRQLFISVQPLPGLGDHFPNRVIWLSPVDAASAEFLLAQANDNTHKLDDFRMLIGADYRLAYKNLPIPVALYDKARNLVDVNDAYVTSVEAASAKQVIKKQIHLTERPPETSIDKAFSGVDRGRERQFGLIKRDRRHLLVTTQKLNTDRAIAAYIDVSGEEEAQIEITRLLDSQTETLNRLRTPVAIFSSDKMLRFFNAAFCRISKLDADWLRGNIEHGDVLDAMRANRRVPELIDYQSWKAKRLEAYTGLLEAEEEMWHLADGSTYRVVTQPYPFGGILILFEDITDKLVLERKYNTLIAVQRETLNNLKDAVAVFAEDTTLSLANRAFNQMWGLDDKIIDDKQAFKRLSDAFKKSHPVFTDADGNTRDLLVDIPIAIANGQGLAGRVVINNSKLYDFTLTTLPDNAAMWSLTDISESMRAERALIERNAALETADRMRTNFVTNISYELRTPLNAISGFAELMQMGISGNLNDRQKGYLGDILSASDGLKKMVSDILDLAVLQSGRMALDYKSVDAAILLADAASLATDYCTQKSIAFKSDITCAAQIETDTLRLKQAFMNIVSCAAAITSRGESLAFESRCDADHLILSFTSTFCAATEDSRDELLQSLKSGALPEQRRSTGIDLALARSIVALHQGSLTLEPYKSIGMTITASLPLTQDKAADA